MKLQFNIGNRYFRLTARCAKGVPVRGILNVATDGSGRRCFFADFDADFSDKQTAAYLKKAMLAGIERACKKYNVRVVALFRTAGGWHAVSPELGTYAESVAWAIEAGADRKFISAGVSRRWTPEERKEHFGGDENTSAFVLRIGEDKKFDTLLTFPVLMKLRREIDNGHLYLLEEMGARFSPSGRHLFSAQPGEVSVIEYMKFPHQEARA